MFAAIKDSLASTAAKTLLAGRIDRYAKIVDLRIRSRDRTIYVEILLEGDEVPVGISVENYRILASSGEYALVVEKATASRAWLQNVLEDFLVGKPVPVPAVALIALGKPD